jgi:intracellular septation protein
MTPGRWARIAIDYAGLLAFLLVSQITGDVMVASIVVVVGSLVALAAGFLLDHKLAPIPLVTAIFGILFGGATLLFHNPHVLKMKPTILYACFGAFLVRGALRGQNPLKALMGDAFHLPDAVVRTLTLRYALFFFALAVGNEIVWRVSEQVYGPGAQATRIWSWYKFPGAPIAIFLFAMAQAPLMLKHAPPEDEPSKG